MMRISVVIITFNEERNIERCIRSVLPIADEILIADSQSTDKTAELARQMGAVVLEHPFLGYGEQKNLATAYAKNDWILSLDADEELSPTLQKSILQIKEKAERDVYEMPRLTNYCGKWIRHCGWYPDRQTRLYNRKKGKWVEQKVHEYWELTDAKGAKGQLNGDLLHYSFSSVTAHLHKIEKYTELAAKAAVAAGRDAGLLKIWLSPKWHFFTEYFLKRGFLDGYYGYMICKMSAYTAFIKYSKIRLYNRITSQEE